MPEGRKKRPTTRKNQLTTLTQLHNADATTRAFTHDELACVTWKIIAKPDDPEVGYNHLRTSRDEAPKACARSKLKFA